MAAGGGVGELQFPRVPARSAIITSDSTAEAPISSAACGGCSVRDLPVVLLGNSVKKRSEDFFLKINLFYLFIYFWLRWVFVAAHGLSLVVASGGYSSLWCVGFSLQWLLLLQSTGSRHVGSVVVAHGLSSCGSRALEHRLSSCGAWA